MALAAVRMVETIVTEHEGEPVIVLRDPEGYVEEHVVLSPAAYYVACLLDGKNDIADIQRQFKRDSGGVDISSETILKIVNFLDEKGFLLTPRFRQLRDNALAAFAREPIRPAALAGKSYPDTPDALRAMLNTMYEQNLPPSSGKETAQVAVSPVKGLIAPHIDFERGQGGYARAYKRLKMSGPPPVVFIFGVAHAPAPVPFILTRKDFATPFGTLRCKKEWVERLARLAAPGMPPYSAEFIHRSEHSIEFQAVMLAHLFGTGFEIVPVLCGAFTDPDAPESTLENTHPFLEECAQLADSVPGTVIIAGADMAHVGPCFGDNFEVNDAVVAQVEARDRQHLGYALKVDPEGWYRSVISDHNAFRICGVNAIYALLKILEERASTAELLDWRYAPDPAGGIVSFSSVAFS